MKILTSLELSVSKSPEEGLMKVIIKHNDFMPSSFTDNVFTELQDAGVISDYVASTSGTYIEVLIHTDEHEKMLRYIISQIGSKYLSEGYEECLKESYSTKTQDFMEDLDRRMKAAETKRHAQQVNNKEHANKLPPKSEIGLMIEKIDFTHDYGLPDTHLPQYMRNIKVCPHVTEDALHKLFDDMYTSYLKFYIINKEAPDPESLESMEKLLVSILEELTFITSLSAECFVCTQEEVCTNPHNINKDIFMEGPMEYGDDEEDAEDHY